MKKASAVLEFHILFFLFVLRRFRLQLFFLLLQILHLFRDGVLRLRLLFNLALFRRNHFAYPVANIFQRLKLGFDLGQLRIVFCNGLFQSVKF